MRVRKRVSGGFVLIELLLVVVVMAILAAAYFNHGPGEGPAGQSTYQRTMTKSNDAACLANRNSLRTNIEMFRMNNPTAEVNTDNVTKAGYSVPSCPDGGAFGYTREGQLLCSVHTEQR